MSNIVGTDGDDTLVGTTGADVMDGGLGKDRLNGGDGDDIVSGGDGNDYVYGDAGNDQLYGGAGNDALVGDAGDDLIYGGDGNDGVFGGGSNDTIFGEAGNDTIFGDGGNDVIDGGDGIDKLYGGSGDDRIFGGMGDDGIDGGTGNDTLVYQFGTGTDRLAGGVGFDTVELVVSEADMPVIADDLAAFAAWLDAQYDAVGGDVNALTGQSAGESFTFSSMNLTVTAIEDLNLLVDGVAVDWRGPSNAAPEVAETQAVDVDEDGTVTGSVGAVDPDGDALTHEIVSGPVNGTVTLDAQTGMFTYTPAENYSGSDSFEVVVTDANGESVSQVVNVTVNAVADTPELAVADVVVALGGMVEGTGGSDVLYGTVGSDMIVGGNGNDVLYAGPSGDVSYIVALDIQAALADVDGSETLSVQISGVPQGASLSAGQEVGAGVWEVGAGDLAGLTMSVDTPSDLTLTVTAVASEVSGATASQSASLTVTFEGVEGTEGQGVVDILQGGGGNDRMYGDEGLDYVDFSTADNGVYVSLWSGFAVGQGFDRFWNVEGVIGSDNSDVVRGNNGDNVVIAGSGNDYVSTYGGADVVHDGAGRDIISAGSGNDTIVASGDGDFDRFDGGSGVDIVDYSGVVESLDVDLGNGQVRGATGKDLLFSIEGVTAGAGNDVLEGSDGDDILNGGAGDDVLRSERGFDILTGGEGSDTFVFDESDIVSGSNYHGFDTITDFGVGDQLDFSDFGHGNRPMDMDDLRVTETAQGTMVSVNMGKKTGFVDVVMLEDVHGMDLADLIDGDHFIF